MSLTNAASIRPLDRLTAVLLAIVLLTLLGGYLLLSAAESLTLVDGAVEWQAQSPLRAVVEVLCLNYRFPTVNAGDIKGYILGMGAAAALAAIGVAVLSRSRETLTTDLAETLADNPVRVTLPSHRVPMAATAQLLAILYVLWSFASSRWSNAPQLATAGSVLLGIQILWAVALASGIRSDGVRYIVRGFLAITLLTGLVAVWYYHGRNPTLRAKFPFGNPTFLAAGLVPGLLLALAWIAYGVRAVLKPNAGFAWFWLVVAVAAAGAGFWAFYLADSRGAQAGLGAGALAGAYFALRGRWRLAPILLSLVLGLAAWAYFGSTASASMSGRGETLRLRVYAWEYAYRLFADRPLSGHGQGAYTLLADTFVTGDVLSDPLVFDGPIAHAHNEWLEVLADLGIVGLALTAMVLLLTLWSVQRAVARADAEHRWCLIGLGASVAGLAVEECAGVGLRVSEVPVAFYTVLGLTWAASHLEPGRTVDWAATRSWRRTSLAAVALTAALAAMTVTQVDFASARRTYQAQQDMTQGKLEDALRLSTPSLWRLSPQRQLYGDSLRVDSHVRWAERMIHRATERDQKARGTEPIDARVIELAHQDIYFAEEAIKAGGQILKELVQRSPAYMNSGLLEYRINLVRAQAALIRGDHEGTEASRKNAVAALDRELQRQPFRADIAEAFSRFALPEVPLDRVLLVLARPLRLGPLGESTVQRVESLSQSPDFGPAFSALFSGRSSNGKDQASDWLPELLRLGAALNFVTGQYDRARAQLESAAELYVALTPYPALAAAAVHLELAESQFFAEPENPDRAVTAANKAYAMAPHSRLGREFQADVQSRLILYLLAADRERDALEILRRLAPKRMPDDLLRRELGQRLRLLCEALLLRRREAVVLRKPADDLAPRLQRWIDRAIELDPDDMAARFLAADLAVHVGEAEAAARRVREALERGLHPADALAFLRMALERLPGSDPLASLHSELEQSGDLASDKQEP